MGIQVPSGTEASDLTGTGVTDGCEQPGIGTGSCIQVLCALLTLNHLVSPLFLFLEAGLVLLQSPRQP